MLDTKDRRVLGDILKRLSVLQTRLITRHDYRRSKKLQHLIDCVSKLLKE